MGYGDWDFGMWVEDCKWWMVGRVGGVSGVG